MQSFTYDTFKYIHCPIPEYFIEMHIIAIRNKWTFNIMDQKGSKLKEF